MSELVFSSDLSGYQWDSKKKPVFSTLSHSPMTGRDVRIALYRQPVYEFILHNGWMNTADKNSLMAFFVARKGVLDSFLYADEDCDVSNQVIGSGNGVITTFQLIKNTGAAVEWVCNPAPNAQIYVAGALKTAITDYGINWKGEVVFVVAPAVGAVISWSGVAYYRCVFLADELEVSQFANLLYECGEIAFKGSFGWLGKEVIVVAPVVLSKIYAGYPVATTGADWYTSAFVTAHNDTYLVSGNYWVSTDGTKAISIKTSRMVLNGVQLVYADSFRSLVCAARQGDKLLSAESSYPVHTLKKFSLLGTTDVSLISSIDFYSSVYDIKQLALITDNPNYAISAGNLLGDRILAVILDTDSSYRAKLKLAVFAGDLSAVALVDLLTVNDSQQGQAYTTTFTANQGLGKTVWSIGYSNPLVPMRLITHSSEIIVAKYTLSVFEGVVEDTFVTIPTHSETFPPYGCNKITQTGVDEIGQPVYMTEAITQADMLLLMPDDPANMSSFYTDSTTLDVGGLYDGLTKCGGITKNYACTLYAIIGGALTPIFTDKVIGKQIVTLSAIVKEGRTTYHAVGDALEIIQTNMEWTVRGIAEMAWTPSISNATTNDYTRTTTTRTLLWCNLAKNIIVIKVAVTTQIQSQNYDVSPAINTLTRSTVNTIEVHYGAVNLTITRPNSTQNPSLNPRYDDMVASALTFDTYNPVDLINKNYAFDGKIAIMSVDDFTLLIDTTVTDHIAYELLTHYTPGLTVTGVLA